MSGAAGFNDWQRTEREYVTGMGLSVAVNPRESCKLYRVNTFRDGV
ncbi:hypothetical protein PHLH5_02210 [Pseudomonas sp. Cab53]|nr:hypothetical protein PHLH5_02210 [Pseudomonas sp. Cab53]